MLKGAESVTGRKRLGQEHACRRRSTHKMWTSEGGKQNHKAGAERNSRGQKPLFPLESVTSQGLIGGRIWSEEAMQMPPSFSLQQARVSPVVVFSPGLES